MILSSEPISSYSLHHDDHDGDHYSVHPISSIPRITMNLANLSRHGLLQVLEEDKKGLAAIKHRIVSYMEDHDALRTAGQDESLGAIRERTSSLIAQHSALNEVFLERRAAHARQCLLPEILANVFRCAILDLEDSTEPPYRFAYDLSHETLLRNVPPMNVSQVCREWRQVALSTPALWTFICARPESELALRIAVTRTES
ncbi:hypothetical protein SCHPADRAFT_608881 [Schizopora paradoxa]|uniref:Uncharacterized protein n=1 Tax=Schizopora paradoxa TaxID=27342 RepID=A0A0H2RAN3_9AGAM|nr:hypothetical protein SCHPADRAFT_608881 [Schizopora paradoxa]